MFIFLAKKESKSLKCLHLTTYWIFSPILILVINNWLPLSGLMSSSTNISISQEHVTNRREPRSCLGRVFNCTLGSFTDNTKNVAACKWPLLKLKTRPRFCPVSSSLSMNQLKMLARDTHVFCLSVSERKKIWGEPLHTLPPCKYISN